jgi:hypothetical protein
VKPIAIDDVQEMLFEIVYDRLDDWCDSCVGWMFIQYSDHFDEDFLIRVRKSILENSHDRIHPDLQDVVKAIDNELPRRKMRINELTARDLVQKGMPDAECVVIVGFWTELLEYVDESLFTEPPKVADKTLAAVRDAYTEWYRKLSKNEVLSLHKDLLDEDDRYLFAYAKYLRLVVGKP